MKYGHSHNTRKNKESYITGMIETHDSSPIAYKSLADIRLHKEMVRNDIIKDDQKIKALWNDLFHKSAMLNASATPSKRLNGLMTTGAGILDGIILGWKLYRKFKK
ncbi:hypothetical protein HMPREF6485_1977 [Segatella buccae ATCC 33574]|jgi:hypothetical protein|uniref:Uncharacterized protein n=2 Tax=Segatella buccae TaxID=28126 RepID=E6K8P1_9BACT|nr:hypothetical protein HMPREF6485_1977 [Segatella buccae ATCC 33574]